MKEVFAIAVPGTNLLMANTATPNNEPRYKVICAAFADALLQKIPNKNTVVIGGAI